jgi:hypothetical protein
MASKTMFMAGPKPTSKPTAKPIMSGRSPGGAMAPSKVAPTVSTLKAEGTRPTQTATGPKPNTNFMAPPPVSKFKDPVLPKGRNSAPKPPGRSRSGYKTGGGFKNGGAIKKAGKK